MLTLADNAQMGAFTVYRDVAYQGGVRTLTPTFYAVPSAPRLAVDDDGGPAFRFWWYRRQLDPSATLGADAVRAGGLLILTVGLGPSGTERSQLKRDIATKYEVGGGADAVNLLPMPFVSGSVTLAFAAESGGGGDFVNAVAGNGPARLAGDERATFAVDLTRDGAALLAQTIDGPDNVLHVRYDLAFTYHLDGVALHVWADARKAQAAAQAQAARGALAAGLLREQLTVSQAAGLSIDSDVPVPVERHEALIQLGEQLLEASLAAAVIAPDGKSARPFDDSMTGTLNHTFTSSFGAEQRFTAETLLPLALGAVARDTRVVTCDLTADAAPLDITVICPVAFDVGLVTSVHAFLVYEGHGPDGAAIRVAGDVVFRPGVTRFAFHALASATERTYRWRADVGYRDGTSASLPEVVADDSILILDVGGLGVLDVTVSLGDVPLDVVTSVIVELEHPPSRLTHQVILDGGHASETWQAVIGDTPPAGLRWRPTFVTDTTRITGDWQASSGVSIIVDAPRGLATKTTVHLVSAGDFAGLAQIVIDVAGGADGTGDAARFTFTAAGQTQVWTSHVLPGAALAYRARQTVIANNGTTRAGEWTTHDTAFLVVTDQSHFTVQVVGALLDIGGAWTAAVVAFEHRDLNGNPDQRDTVVLRDRTIDGSWTFLPNSPLEHAYRYQLSLVPSAGSTRRVLPWQDADDKVLVLRTPGN